MDQVSAKSYLQSEVFPKLESALNTVCCRELNQFGIAARNYREEWRVRVLCGHARGERGTRTQTAEEA